MAPLRGSKAHHRHIDIQCIALATGPKGQHRESRIESAHGQHLSSGMVGISYPITASWKQHNVMPSSLRREAISQWLQIGCVLVEPLIRLEPCAKAYILACQHGAPLACAERIRGLLGNRTVLRLLDLDHAKIVGLQSLSSPRSPESFSIVDKSPIHSITGPSFAKRTSGIVGNCAG